MRLATQYLRIYPDDWNERLNLAYLLLENRRCEESIAQNREVLRIAPDSVNAHTNIATCLTLLGKYAEALGSYKNAFDIEPSLIEDVFQNHQYGVALILAGQPAKAREVYAIKLRSPEAGARARGYRSTAFVDMYEGKYRAAQRSFERNIQELPAGAFALVRARLFLSQALGAQGDTKGRLRELEHALSALEPEPKQLGNMLNCRIGVELTRMGEIARAEQVREVCRRNVDKESLEDMADWRRLEGELELARGNKERALEALIQANPDHQRPLMVESLARSYELAGRSNEAIAAYEKLMGMSDIFGWEMQQPWTEAHVALARLYIAKGEKEKARTLLDTLLARWKNADPDLPLLLEARKLRDSLGS